MTSRAVKPNREDSGHRAVARCRVPAADMASVGRGLDCVLPVHHGGAGQPGKSVPLTPDRPGISLAGGRRFSRGAAPAGLLLTPAHGGHSQGRASAERRSHAAEWAMSRTDRLARPETHRPDNIDSKAWA